MRRVESNRGNSKGGREQPVGVNEATRTIQYARANSFAINNTPGGILVVSCAGEKLRFTYATNHSCEP